MYLLGYDVGSSSIKATRTALLSRNRLLAVHYTLPTIHYSLSSAANLRKYS